MIDRRRPLSLPAAALTALILVASSSVARADASAGPDALAPWYIGAGQEALIGSLLQDGLDEAGWRLESAEVRYTRLVAAYRRTTGGETVQITFVHPSVAPAAAARTEKLAVLAPRADIPPELLEAVLGSIRKHESGFEWSAPPDGASPSRTARTRRTVDGSDLPGLLAEARHAVDIQDRDTALALVDQVLAAGEDAFWARREAGYILRQLGETERARVELEASLAILAERKGEHPAEMGHDPAGAVPRARALIGLDRVDEANALLDELLSAATPETVCAASGVADDHMRTGRLAEGRAFLERLLEQNPDCADAYVRIAHVARAQGDWEAVVPVLAQGAERLPDDPAVVGQLADAYKLLGRRLEAIRILEELVDRGHDQPSTIASLLGIYTRETPPEGTFERYLARADADPDDHIANFFSGVLLHYVPDYARSNEYMERVKVRMAAEPRVWIYLSMNHFRLGNQEAAKRYIAQPAAVEHPDPDVYYCRAEIMMNEDPEGALLDLQRYLHLTEGSPDSFEPKQAMVRRNVKKLERCLGAKVPTECMAMIETQRRSGWALATVGFLAVTGALVAAGRRRRRMSAAPKASTEGAAGCTTED